jgi:uncharacterized membrane protein
MARNARSWQVGRHVAPPRFIAFGLVLAIAVAAAWSVFHLRVGRSVLIGFDIAAALFLLSLAPLLDDRTEEMRQRSEENDANRAGLLALTALVLMVILIAVASELAGRPSGTAVALVIGTLTLAWLFANTVWALHYAHVYYSDADADQKDDGGLGFPNCEEPSYWDFLYFSFTLGMTFQTSDVTITSARMRRIALGQCMAAFVFNLGVLAFTINVLGN